VSDDDDRKVITSIPGSFTFLVGSCMGIAGPRWPLAVIVWLLALMLMLTLTHGVTGVAFMIVRR
jgi:hypothetical protein